MIHWLIALLVAACMLGGARAERSDRDKPLNYEADSGECDDLQQVCVLAGNVVLVKGTMRATGDRVQIRKDPEGYQYGLIQAAPGKVATFRQRRDTSQPGVEEFVDGQAERIEYDEKSDTVKLLSRARVRMLENDVPATNCAAMRLPTTSATPSTSSRAARRRATPIIRRAECAARSPRAPLQPRPGRKRH
jgi:lipopolysaccharide transport protein LptA